MTNEKSPGPAAIDTLCVHGGQKRLAPEFGLNTPIVTSSAFDYRADHVRYPRYLNTLNHQVVGDKIAALEGAESGLVTASGMGAISAIFLTLMKPGDHAVLLDGLYGGTTDLVEGLLKPYGMRFSTWNGAPEQLTGLFEPDTRLLMVESPTNPLLDIIDLKTAGSIAREHGVISVIDNTFATPVLQRPIEMGCDLVMHSATKFMGGHSDLLSGALAGSTELVDRIRPQAIRLGSSLNGQDLALLERSLKTLAIRVRCQSDNALAIAEWLHGCESVEQVFHPGLAGHPGHGIAARQMAGYGPMLSFRLNQRLDPATVFDRLALIQPAVSLGGVESTICQPSRTSHAKLADAERQRLGIDDQLLRLSVGIESVDDLRKDLAGALGWSAA